MNKEKRVTAIARLVAIAVALVMVWYFATQDVIRSDNPFLVPDALLTVLLLTAAALPRRMATPGLIFAFAFATAVYSVSLCTYIVRNAFVDGADHLALILPMLVMETLLIRNLVASAAVEADHSRRRS